MAECLTCAKIKEKKAKIVYEDDKMVAILPARPACPGHIKILPKSHYSKIEEMEDDLVEQVLLLSSYSSAAVFEVLRAHGSNIIMNETQEHLAIDVLPRRENDGMNFMWQPKPMAPEQLDDVFSKLKDKAFVVGKSEKKQPLHPVSIVAVPHPPSKKKDEEVRKSEKPNYLLKQLERCP